MGESRLAKATAAVKLILRNLFKFIPPNKTPTPGGSKGGE